MAGAKAEHAGRTGDLLIYSDLAIEIVLMLRMVFRLALRQAEAFAGSVLRLLGFSSDRRENRDRPAKKQRSS